MPKTAADIPPVVKGDYAKMQTPSAVAQADGDGYTPTAPMKRAQLPGKRAKQYGLPKTGKPFPAKVRDTDKDKM